MTIDEAIKILRDDIAEPGSRAIEDINEAEALSIEALKLVEEWRRGRYFTASYLLPGETKD